MQISLNSFMTLDEINKHSGQPIMVLAMTGEFSARLMFRSRYLEESQDICCTVLGCLDKRDKARQAQLGDLKPGQKFHRTPIGLEKDVWIVTTGSPTDESTHCVRERDWYLTALANSEKVKVVE